ncbi:hypothetical protein ACXXIA_07935 [Staphylococcus epidermidis]
MENNKFVLSSLAILSVVLIVIVLIFYIKSLNQNQVINEYRELKNENTNLIREKERMSQVQTPV